jgi:hypothetical protein
VLRSRSAHCKKPWCLSVTRHRFSYLLSVFVGVFRYIVLVRWLVSYHPLRLKYGGISYKVLHFSFANQLCNQTIWNVWLLLQRVWSKKKVFVCCARVEYGIQLVLLAWYEVLDLWRAQWYELLHGLSSLLNWVLDVSSLSALYSLYCTTSISNSAKWNHYCNRPHISCIDVLLWQSGRHCHKLVC